MKRVLAGLILVVLLGGGIAYNLRPPRQSPAVTTKQESVAEVHQSSAEPGILKPYIVSRKVISLIGTVKADRQAIISTKIPARIAGISVRAGDKVTAEKSLIRLEDIDVKAQADAARAALDGANAQYKKAIEGKRARKIEMVSKVSEARGGLATALAKLRQAELGLLLSNSTAVSDVERAEAAIRQAESGLKQANIGVSHGGETVQGP